MSRVGLMPVTILVREGNQFVNHQALTLPETFSISEFRLGRDKLLISMEPWYLLVEPKAEIELSFYEDENNDTPLWSKRAPVMIGSRIAVSSEDKRVLKKIASGKVYFKMILRAKDYQSEQITGSADFYIMDSAKD